MVLGAAALALAACTFEGPSGTGAPVPTGGSVAVTETAAPTASPTVEVSATPSATPEPPLSLPIAAVQDPREVTVSVTTEVPADAGGVITVSVTSGSAEMIEELVLRWPAELNDALFLSPRLPDPDLVRDRGGNLVVPWTKWVLGPGEHGEPAGTISLGYGPLDPEATLVIPLFVMRNAPGPLEFDLQILAGETILSFPDGAPAELRVEVP